MAGRHQGRGQSVAGAVPQPQTGAGGDLGAGAFRLVAAAARAGNHRVGVPGRDRSQSGDPASVARTRRQHLDGRFRHRLFQPQLSPQLSVRQDQDRPLVRARIWSSARTAWRSCAAISGLGRSLDITTTAEGVETDEQLDWLRAEGCNEVQGFLFSAAQAGIRDRGIAGSLWCARLAGGVSRRGFRQGRAYLRGEQHSSCCSAD